MHLGHADRQRAHARRDQRGAARAAGGDDAGDVALPRIQSGESFRHRADRGAAIGAEHAASRRADG